MIGNETFPNVIKARMCPIVFVYPKKGSSGAKGNLIFMKCFHKTAMQLLYFFGYITTENNYKQIKEDP